MRKAKGHAHGQTRVYIPSAEDNRDAVDPVKVTIRQPTEAERRKMRDATISLEYTDDGVKSVPSGLDAREIAIKNYVVNVEGYLDSQDNPIKNGEDFWNHGESAFVFEVAREILIDLSGLTEEEKKL